VGEVWVNQFTPSTDKIIVPFIPTAIKELPSLVIPNKSFAVLEVCVVQLIPSGDEKTAPPSPIITNLPAFPPQTAPFKLTVVKFDLEIHVLPLSADVRTLPLKPNAYIVVPLNKIQFTDFEMPEVFLDQVVPLSVDIKIFPVESVQANTEPLLAILLILFEVP
jgi:hypothetical protein